MLLTAIAAYVTVNTALINLAANPIVLLVAVVAEFGLVLGISFGFNKISSGTAGGGRGGRGGRGGGCRLGSDFSALTA
ncbi:MAG: hypothetical protein IPN58_18865 [Anaerolineales bacterium]|nr:hypothetical protein [Anaerolineales bacterium]